MTINLRPTVRPLTAILRDAISLCKMKLSTDIHPVSGYCWKNFKVMGQRSRSCSDGRGNIVSSIATGQLNWIW